MFRCNPQLSANIVSAKFFEVLFVLKSQVIAYPVTCKDLLDSWKFAQAA
jgi:hypothetical protein